MKTDQLDQIESHIETGDLKKADQLMTSLLREKVPRRETSRAANLLRRMGNPGKAVKVLNPIVRSKNHLIEPSSIEILEYASALAAIGGSEETIELLSDPTLQESHPRSLLYMAIACFTQWNYQAAIPYLDKFITATEGESYQNAIGRVNKIAALVTTQQRDLALEDLNEIIPLLREQNYNLLLGNCYELKAQVLYGLGKNSEAKESLNFAEQLIGPKKYPDILYVKKWKALMGVAENPLSYSALDKINEMKRLASAYGHWETLRDLDFRLALILKDEHLYNKVYYGTPYQLFRTNMELENSNNIKFEKKFIRSFGEKFEPKYFWNVEEGCVNSQRLLSPGKLNYNLLLNLSIDFYKPIRIPTLFSKLYPDEYFNPESSWQKVQMLISRLRDIIQPYGLDVKSFGRFGYQIFGMGEAVIQYNHIEVKKSLSLVEHHYAVIFDKYGFNQFSCKDFADQMNTTNRTALRWIKSLQDEDKIVKIGDRKKARYHLKKVS